MRRIPIFVLLLLIMCTPVAHAQKSGELRLFLEPGVTEMPGDGDTTTTITVTLRDSEGELVNKSGTVHLKLNAGRLSHGQISLHNGIGQVIFTAPILDNESKVFQRSIRLTMEIVQRLSGKSASQLTGKNRDKMAMKTTRDTAMEMASAAGMTSVQGKKPTVHIIGEMNELRGKCEIRILKVEGGVSAGLVPGIYSGRDVTGSSRWELRVRRGGPGYTGTLRTGGGEMSFRSKGEKKSGFLIVYLFDERDMQATKNTGFLGWPTAMKVLPGNALYMVAPPVYLLRKGDIPQESSVTEAESEAEREMEPEPEPEPADKISLVVKRNMLPGDGESETQVAFIYRDKKGRPKTGVPVRLQVGRGGMGGRLIQPKGTTDPRGIFRCRYRAPIFKTNKFQQLGTCKNDIVWAYYREGKEEKYITAKVGILRCTDAKLVLDKPGFEEKNGLPIVIASPWGSVTGTILAKVTRLYARIPFEEKTNVPIAFAKVYLTGGAITGNESIFKAKTDKNGKLKMELKFHNWGVYFSHKLKAPFIYPFSEVHRKRRDSLSKNLYMFPDKGFQERAAQKVYAMELGVVQEPTEVAKGYEAKFQLLGDLMATYWMSEKLVADTTGEVVSQGWSILGIIWDWADKKFKFSKKIKKAAREGRIVDLVFKGDEAGSKSIKRMIFRKFNAIVTRNQKSSWGRPAVLVMDHANGKIFSALKQLLGFLADYLSKITGTKFPQNPIPDLIKQEVLFHYRRQTMPYMERFLGANPQAVLDAYDDVHPWLVNNSGNLRKHYQNVAWTRLVVEETKAWKDLSVELSHGLAIGIAVSTGQVWALTWWDKYKKFTDMLDKAYAGSAFLGELYTCASLMAECQELFVHTNRAIGAVDNPLVQRKPSLFPLAYADQLKGHSQVAPPAIFTVDVDDLQLRNGTIPTASVRRLANSYARFLDWEKKVDSVWMLAMDKSEVEDFVEARQAYSDAMETLAVITAVADDQPLESGLQDRWEDLVDDLEDQGKRVDKYATKAYQQGLQRQTAMRNDERRVETYARRKPGKSLMGGKQGEASWQVIVISGAGFLIVLIFLIVGLKWKSGRNRAWKSDSNPVAINSDSIPSDPRLVVPGGDEIPLKGSAITIGSQSNNQIVLPYADVLPCHAVLHVADTGQWWIGTGVRGVGIQVNGETGQSFWLSHGSRIRLGSAELIFLIS